ncbi:MAG: CapA family protein [Epulopiscium sp.]|nr:CapA family protein [Candidatus Epulonipiscium sp.]
MGRRLKRKKNNHRKWCIFLGILICIASIQLAVLTFVWASQNKNIQKPPSWIAVEEGKNESTEEDIGVPVEVQDSEKIDFNVDEELQEESLVEDEEATIIKPIRKNITISAAGDFTLGNYLPTYEANTFDDVFRKQGQDYTYFLSNVKEIFEADDLTLVNLEGPLTNATAHMDKPFPFKGAPSYVNILTSGSVEAVNVANNHSHDYFEQGHQDTLRALENASVGYYGYGHQYIKEIEGVKIGVLGYKTWAKTDPFIATLKKEITYMKEKTDLLIVSFHWGDERTYFPNEVQKYFAHLSIDLGADLIIGHHPHVIQGIERYKDRAIVYSLGNFCYGGHRNPPDKDTFIFQQTFVFDEDNQWLIEESTENIIPCRISSVIHRNDYRPTPLEGEEKERLYKRIEELSAPLSIQPFQ